MPIFIPKSAVPFSCFQIFCYCHVLQLLSCNFLPKTLKILFSI
nr:MAG TPA: hypothetical protein [Caudoviricetes sp.]